MKFNDMKYSRLDIDLIKNTFSNSIIALKNARSFDDADSAFTNAHLIMDKIQTMSSLASIKFSQNSTDEFYLKEIEFLNKNSPIFEKLISDLYTSILSSKFVNSFSEKYGSHFIQIIDYKTKLISDDTIDFMIEDNKLCSRYTEILSQGVLEFNGEKFPLPGISPYLMNSNRTIRKESNIILNDFFNCNKCEFENIFDTLVHNRNNIAKVLGFNDYVEYSYVSLMRYDYTPSDIQKFRDAIKKHLVPLLSKYSNKKKNRFNYDKIYFYDEPIEFLEGSINPILDYENMISAAKKMYEELSPETGSFFNFMLDNELMDLKTRENKSPGGYCDLLKKYKSPFIFANFNGTSDDVDVLTHEAGHAFDVYMNRNEIIDEYIWGGFDVAEIHSMSMEFLTYPWMENFFGKNKNKYKYNHILNALKFIPYGLLVDEFQEKIYKNPNLRKEDRNDLWRNLEKEYLPNIDYDGYEPLENGTYWFRQSHIFKNPFYYIDYVLAEIIALQFYAISEINHDDAIKKYKKLISFGGKHPFRKLLKLSDLETPFSEDNICKIINIIDQSISNINL